MDAFDSIDNNDDVDSGDDDLKALVVLDEDEIEAEYNECIRKLLMCFFKKLN